MFGPPWLGAFGYIAQIANIALDPALHAAPSLLKKSQNGSVPLLLAMDSCFSQFFLQSDLIQSLFDEIQLGILSNEEYSDDMRIVKVFQRLENFSSTDLSIKSWKSSENSTIEGILSMNEADSATASVNSSMEIVDSVTDVNSTQESEDSSTKLARTFNFERNCGEIQITPEVKIKNFMDIGKFYEKISEVDQILSGNSTIFIDELQKSQRTVDEKTQIVLQEIIDNLLVDFDKYHEPFHRLKLVVDEINRFSKDNPENSAFREVEVGHWGRLSDTLNVYAMYRYKGWHWIETSNSTCSNVLSIIKPNENNETLLFNKLQYAYDASLRYSRRFEPFLGLIRRELRDRNESTSTELLIHVCRILNGFADPGSGRLEEVLEIQLEPDMSIKEACDCVNVRPPPGYEEAVERMKRSRLRRFSLLWPFL